MIPSDLRFDIFIQREKNAISCSVFIVMLILYFFLTEIASFYYQKDHLN